MHQIFQRTHHRPGAVLSWPRWERLFCYASMDIALKLEEDPHAFDGWFDE